MKMSVSSRIRALVKRCLNFSQTYDAVYWAEKLVSVSNENVEDIYLLCRALYMDKQFKRCVICITKQSLDTLFPAFCLLTAMCHFELKEWDEALSVLEGGNFSALGKPKQNNKTNRKFLTASENIDWGMTSNQIKSRIALIMGKVYEVIENRELASKSFKEALQWDVYCHEAFAKLTEHHLLTGEEEQELFESLPFEEQCSSEDISCVKFLYECKLKKYNQIAKSHSAVSLSVQPLMKNLEVRISFAERLFYNNQFHQCYKITKEIMMKEPFFKPVLLLHISVLCELSKTNELFSLAHNLIDYHPEWAVSWLAVGCYYFLIGRQDPARRYISRALAIDNMHAPSWLVNGHSFAQQNEHDQAMASYFTASKLMRGFHLPFLYVGLEYAVTNNLTLAEKFTRESLAIAPHDPNVLHELAVILYKKEDYQGAEMYLSSAMEKISVLDSKVLSQKWEPLFNNMGHVYRSLGRYKEALEYHEKALNLMPSNSCTHANIGTIYCYMSRWGLAINSFHKALSLKREDAYAEAMLKISLEQMLLKNNGENFLESFEQMDLLSIGPIDKKDSPLDCKSSVLSNTTSSFLDKNEDKNNDNYVWIPPVDNDHDADVATLKSTSTLVGRLRGERSATVSLTSLMTPPSAIVPQSGSGDNTVDLNFTPMDFDQQ